MWDWSFLHTPPYLRHTSLEAGEAKEAFRGLNHLLITAPSPAASCPTPRPQCGPHSDHWHFHTPTPFLLHRSRCLCFARSRVVATSSPRNHHGATWKGQRVSASVKKPKHRPGIPKRAKEMTPKVPSPRYFNAKFPWDSLWRNKNALYAPPCTPPVGTGTPRVQRSCCRRKRQIQGTSMNPCRAHVQRACFPEIKGKRRFSEARTPG